MEILFDSFSRSFRTSMQIFLIMFNKLIMFDKILNCSVNSGEQFKNVLENCAPKFNVSSPTPPKKTPSCSPMKASNVSSFRGRGGWLSCNANVQPSPVVCVRANSFALRKSFSALFSFRCISHFLKPFRQAFVFLGEK